MDRVSTSVVPLRPLLLLCAIAIALVIGTFLQRTATAWDRLPQESPLSPIEAPVEVEEASPLIIPVGPDAVATEERTAEAPPALTLPLGEPLEAQTSLYLVGLVLAGLLGAVVLLVVQQRRS